MINSRGQNKVTLGEARKSTLKMESGENKMEGWIFVSGERQRRKARERKIRKQTKLKNDVNSTAVLNDDRGRS